MNRINEIIEKYRSYGQLYKELKQFHVEKEISSKEETEIINKIKNIIVNYYLATYKYKDYTSNEIQDTLLSNISRLCDLSKKVKNKNGKNKIYPVKASDAKKEENYKKVINIMVEYQMKHYISIEELFNKFANDIGNQLNSFKQKLMQNDMDLYYGSMYYLIERAIYIINCIKQIPIKTPNLEEMEKSMQLFKQKYLDPRSYYEKDDDYTDVNDEFYKDYDLIESNYKELLMIEHELFPIVVEEWKKYLTSPLDNDSNYRYVMHCFTSGIVDPKLMRKACCSLYTPTIKNSMYGNFGLIYDIDVDSVDTLCADDAGSWGVNKEFFIERDCPGRWQLTSLDGDSVWYEYPYNSKLILPSVFENECATKIKNGMFQYSEIFLNKNARPIGVFYTSECQNIEEIESYAEKNNLPLIKIDTKEIKL